MAVNDTLFDKGGAVYNVKATGYGVVGNGTTDDRAALAALFATITAGGTAYFPPGTYRIATDLVIPAGVAVAFAAGARIKPDSTRSLTVNGPLQAPLSQVFDTSAGGLVALGRGVSDHVYPQWFGAKADTVRRMAGAGSGGTIAAGSTTLTVQGGFTDTATDAGKLVRVSGAGAGGDLSTTIVSVTNANTATLAAAATTSQTNTGVTIGTDDYAAIAAAVAAMAGGGTAYFPPGTYAIASNLTIPSRVAVAFAAGARIRPDATRTLTINGPLQAPLSQVFDTSAGGLVTFGRGVSDHVYPQWFGAKGDAIRRDTGVGNGASITAGSTTLTVPAGFTDTATDAGKLVTVTGAGAATGQGTSADLYTTIVSVSSANTATLAAAAATSKTNTGVTIGTDDYAAVAAAVATAIRGAETGLHKSVYFPAGGYLIGNGADREPVLSAFPELFKFGILFQGEGMMSSELILRTGGTAQWFYSDISEGKLGFPTFADLRFTADTPAYGNGFKLSDTQGHGQFFVFRNCTLSGLKQGFEFTGTVMDSEMRYYACKFMHIDQFYRIANAQSVDHEFFGCDIEGVTSDIFYVTGGGGGSVRMYGGSIIWSPSQTADGYLLHVDSTLVGYGNSDFTFNGIRTEMHTVHAKLVKYTPDQGELVANFEACNLVATVIGGSRQAVHVGLNKSVRFAGCSLPADWTYRIDTPDSRAPGYPTHGIIGFEGCVVPPDLSARIVVANTYGRAYARDCHVRQESGTLVREAVNFDLNGFNDMPGDPGSILKVAVIKPAGFAFPMSSGGEQTLRLPAGATIRSVHVYRPAGSGTANYQLHVGSDDKTVILASSAAATDASVYTIHQDVFYPVGTSARTIRLWANPPGQAVVTGGYAFVEYY